MYQRRKEIKKQEFLEKIRREFNYIQNEISVEVYGTLRKYLLSIAEIENGKVIEVNIYFWVNGEGKGLEYILDITSNAKNAKEIDISNRAKNIFYKKEK